MAENGKKLISFIGSLIGTFLAVLYAIYQLVYAPLNSALAGECSKRESVDSILFSETKEIRAEISAGIKEQMLTNQRILVMLAEIRSEVKR